MNTRHPLTRLLLPLVTAALLAAAGCSGSGDGGGGSPTDPGGGDPVDIKTPVSLTITKVTVSAFGEKNGGVWDASLTVAARRPDIYVTLSAGVSAPAPFYVSTIEEDAFSGAFYDFTSSSAGVGLPKTHTATRTLVCELWDEDGLSADDLMGSASFIPLSYYDDDNAAGFYKTFTGSNSLKISVHGTWNY